MPAFPQIPFETTDIAVQFQDGMSDLDEEEAQAEKLEKAEEREAEKEDEVEEEEGEEKEEVEEVG